MDETIHLVAVLLYRHDGGEYEFATQPIIRNRDGLANVCGNARRVRIQPDHEDYDIYTQFAEANPPNNWAKLLCSENTSGELIAQAEFFYDDEKNTWYRFDPNWVNEDLSAQLTGSYEWTSENLPPVEKESGR